MKFSLLIVLLVFSSCNAQKSQERSTAHATPGIDRASLKGIWWSSEMPQSAAFQVNDSTFYYPDNFLERSYTLVGDSLFVRFDDGFVSSSAIVKLNADSLILSTDGIVHVYTRAEPKQ